MVFSVAFVFVVLSMRSVDEILFDGVVMFVGRIASVLAPVLEPKVFFTTVF